MCNFFKLSHIFLSVIGSKLLVASSRINTSGLNKNGFIRNPDNTEHGLGLKIVNQIVHLHHGKIKFSANKPHGLIVQISLPRDFTSMPRK